MTAQELGSGVDDDICSVLQWAKQVGACNRVVDNQREPVRVSNPRDTLDVKDVDPRVGNGFPEKSFGVGLNCRLPSFEVVLVVHEGDINPKLRQRVFEKVVGSAIHGRRAHNVVTGVCDIQNRVGRCCLTRSE